MAYNFLSKGYKYSRPSELPFRDREDEDRSEVPFSVIVEVNSVMYRKRIIHADEDLIENILKGLELTKYQKYIADIYMRVNLNQNRGSSYKQCELECPVCFENTTEMVQLSCKHLFCKVCVKKIGTNKVIKCPLCRQDTTTENLNL